MPFEKTKLNYLNVSKINEEQIMVDANFVPEENFSKVLWVEVSPQIDSVDALTKEVSYSGKAVFEVNYLNMENQTRVFKTTVPFLNKIFNENITPNSKITLNICTKSSEFDGKSDKLEAVLEVSGLIVNVQEIGVICDGGEDICVKTEEVNSLDLIKSECVLFNEEINYPITDKMENILNVKSNICVKNVTPNANFFTIEGEINTCIKYLTTSDEIQTIVTANYSESFKREIEVANLTENGKVIAFAKIKYDAYKYELDKESKKLLITAPVNVCYKAFETNIVPTAVDVFSLENNLEIVTNSFDRTTFLPCEFLEQKVEGSVVIGEDFPRIDKIVGFSNGNIQITGTNYNPEAEKLTIDGLISFDVAYLNDETNTTNVLSKEIPFSVSLDIELPENIDIFANVELADMEIIARRGREIFVDAKVKSLINFVKKETDAVITSVDLGENLTTKKHAIEIYFGKTGDDLWDIAKELRVKPETISIQNPDLILPLEQNENIVIYNKREN